MYTARNRVVNHSPLLPQPSITDYPTMSTCYGATSYDILNADNMEYKPKHRRLHTMDPRTWFRDLTPYFIYVLIISTIGPLLFGFHLVCKRRVPGDKGI